MPEKLYRNSSLNSGNKRLKMHFLLIYGLVLFIVAGNACTSQKNDSEKSDLKNNGSSSVNIARVRGVNLTEEQFKKFIKFNTAAFDDLNLDGELLSYYLERFIEHNVLLQEAKQLNIGVNDKELNDKINLIKKQYSDIQEDKEAVNLINMPEWREFVREQMMVQKYVDWYLTATIVVSHDEEVEYFEKQYGNQGSRRLYHLGQIVQFDENIAREVYKKLKEGKEKFEDLAQKYSQAPDSNEGGDIGWYTLSQLPDNVKDAISKLRAGQFSEVLKTENSYVIIQLKDVKVQKPAELIEVQDSIRRKLLQEKREEYMEKHLEKIWNESRTDKTGIQIFQENLDFIYIPTRKK